jgi:hypothetical protein
MRKLSTGALDKTTRRLDRVSNPRRVHRTAQLLHEWAAFLAIAGAYMVSATNAPLRFRRSMPHVASTPKMPAS